MNLKIFYCLTVLVASLSLSAETTFYGKLWITAEYENNNETSTSDLVSNTSRIGFKGDLEARNKLSVIYQLEYEVDPVDGKADESKGRSLKKRNSFIGLKGSYGTLFLGTHDTAFKKSSKIIDLFNDLNPDIKNILHGENRMKDFVGFTTPTSERGFSATFNAIRGAEDLNNNKLSDHLSYSFNYRGENFYAAIALDSDIKGYDSSRYSIHLPTGIYNFGFIYQQSKKISTNKTNNGFVISASRKIGAKGEFKIQLAESDMKLSEGRQLSYGYDYKLNKQFEIFFFYTNLSTSNFAKEKEVAAVGFELKFWHLILIFVTELSHKKFLIEVTRNTYEPEKNIIRVNK